MEESKPEPKYETYKPPTPYVRWTPAQERAFEAEVARLESRGYGDLGTCQTAAIYTIDKLIEEGKL